MPADIPTLRHSQSLRTVIVLTVALGVLLSSAIAFIEQAASYRAEHVAQVEQEVERLSTLTALALREPLWQFVPEQADSIIEAAFVNPDIRMITVWDHKGVSFATRQRGDSSVGNTTSATKVIERDGTPVGTLTIQMSTSGYVAKVESAMRQYLRTALVIMFGSLLVIILVMNWRFVSPVKQLVSASERIATGKLDVPIERRFADEIGILAGSLESTRKALLDLFAELEKRNEALTDANEHLEQRVAERTRSLEEALQRLERAQNEMLQSEKLASLGRIVAGVAHELNTPIGNALTVATTIAEDLNELRAQVESGAIKRSSLNAMVERSSTGIGIFVRNLERAARLIGDFKQVAVDQTSDQRREFDLAAIVDEIANILQPTLRKSNCTLEAELTSGLMCDSYPGAIGQVVTNLIMNTVVHAFEQGTKGKVSLRVCPVGDDGAEIVVADDGVGMSEEVRQRIFDPFFTTKMGKGGSGLGMNLVHGLVTRVLGGSVNVISSPGHGTEVRVQLPRFAPHGAR
jgi:signal transduction histidine kinase